MPCPSCAADNPPGSRFCNQCAAPLVRAAIGPTPDRAGYTPRHLVEKVLRHRSALVGERKRVTVLFADIKGSTRLAGQAGAEAWHAILDRFFSLLAQAVHRYEGTVNQYTGDGVMALFGAPVAHEDHALRACHAALDMQAAIRAFADELRLQRALNLTLRIGLNTGEVVVGRIGDDLRMDYTAQGATVNLAARLEQICEPGQVYLSRATAMQIQDRFSLRGLGAMQVDGIDQAVQVFALESYDRAAAKAPRRLSGGAAGLHGRQAELAQLRALLDEVGQGRGRVVGMVGTAGIGKSRLCHELLVEARQRGIATHRTTASPYARQLSMAAPRDLYLSRIGCPPDADAEDIRACIEAELPGSLRSRPGALGSVMEFAGVGRPGELTEAQAASLRQPMMRQLAQYLSRADSPQVLLFEDLQHLDALTLEFVRLLAAAVAATPTLLLLSWRADAARMDLPGLHQTLQLPPLAPEASSRLAAAWLGPHRSLAGLAARIAERADGNPYFVEEAVIALAETGHLTGTQGAYRLQLPIAQLPIPDTVHALVAARIDRLPPPQKAWLQRAAVIGPDFDTDLLAELSDDRADPRPALAALEQFGLLQREGDVWRFAQPLLREVAYDAQLRASRVALHAQLAAAMEVRSAGQSTQAVARSVAAHWALARQWLAAARWNLEAADGIPPAIRTSPWNSFVRPRCIWIAPTTTPRCDGCVSPPGRACCAWPISSASIPPNWTRPTRRRRSWHKPWTTPRRPPSWISLTATCVCCAAMRSMRCNWWSRHWHVRRSISARSWRTVSVCRSCSPMARSDGSARASTWSMPAAARTGGRGRSTPTTAARAAIWFCTWGGAVDCRKQAGTWHAPSN